MDEKYESVEKLREDIRANIDPSLLDPERYHHVCVEAIPDVSLYNEMRSCGFPEDSIITVFEKTFNNNNDGIYGHPTISEQYNNCLIKIRMMEEHGFPAEKMNIEWLSGHYHRAGMHLGSMESFRHHITSHNPIKKMTNIRNKDIDVEEIKRELPDYLRVFLEQKGE